MMLNKEGVLAIYTDLRVSVITKPKQFNLSAKRTTREFKLKVIHDVLNGMTKIAAAEKYGVSLTTVCRYVRNHTRGELVA